MTDQEWLKEQFEFENCEECGFGEEFHEVVEVLGNPFALCVDPKSLLEETHV